MTITQIGKIIGEENIGKWVSLLDIDYKRIGFSGGEIEFISPNLTNIYYFDAEDNLFFIANVSDPEEVESGSVETTENEKIVTSKEKFYKVKIKPTPSNDTYVGKYHSVIDVGDIVGFFN